MSDSPDAGRLRVWSSLGQREDLGQAMLAEGFPGLTQVPRWLERRRESPADWCLALNGVSAFSEPLAGWICDQLVLPLVCSIGEPSRGFDVYAFMGQYAQTPLGIHTDAEHSLLLHLGPAPKTMWLWDPDEYFETYGSDALRFNCFTAERYRTGREVTMEPGDILLLPPGVPHVAASAELSLTLGVIPNVASAGQVVLDTLRAAIEAHDEAVRDVSFVRAAGTPAAVVAATRAAVAWATPSDGADPAAYASNAARLRLASNGYLVPSPSPVALTRVEVRPDSEFTVPSRYPLRWFGDELYCRGRTVRLPLTASLLAALEHANQTATWRVADLVERCSANWQPGAVLRVLRTLADLGGFEASGSRQR